MKHFYQKGSDVNSPVFLLLHGTGGNETSLLHVAGQINEEAAILSVRGSVLENGMPRFFKRLAEGVFDEEDLILRTKELYQFLDKAAKEYQFDRQNVVAIGYSNGANIVGSLLFHYKNALKGAILHHPMVPRRGISIPELKTNVFIGAGENDLLCPASESIDLENLLKNAGANVFTHWENNGHQLTHTEIEAAKEWYNKHFK